MVGVVHNHLQATYMGLQNSLENDWAFLQLANQGLGYDFHPVKTSSQ